MPLSDIIKRARALPMRTCDRVTRRNVSSRYVRPILVCSSMPRPTVQATHAGRNRIAIGMSHLDPKCGIQPGKPGGATHFTGRGLHRSPLLSPDQTVRSALARRERTRRGRQAGITCIVYAHIESNEHRATNAARRQKNNAALKGDASES